MAMVQCNYMGPTATYKCKEYWPQVDLGIKHQNVALLQSFSRTKISTLYY